MKWLDLAVTPKFSWPNVPVEFSFEGFKVVLQPRRRDPEDQPELAATISVFHPDAISFEVGGTIAGRFLSRLAWSKNGGVIELFAGGSNMPNRPGRLGQGWYQRSSRLQVEPWDYLYLPKADTPEADLALALYREGMSLNSAPFAFLSFFKILNIVFAGGPQQKQWLNDNLQHLQYRPANERLAELQANEPDIGAYLYHQGRCATAHAHGNTIVNPDNYRDKRRLQDDLKLMQELAAIFIERELGVLTDSSFTEAMRTQIDPHPELLKKQIQDGGRIVYVP